MGNLFSCCRNLNESKMSAWEQNEEIKIFREYLRIPSVHPNVDYTDCVTFLKRQADSLALPMDVVYPVPAKPIVIMKWLGQQTTLPSIVLNSHMDVVPVFEEKWTHPPFGADIDANGKIYARGAQDMKCVAIQYLAAVRALKKEGYEPKRTIYLIFVPDEEIGGILGMKEFVKTDYFKKLNVGFAFDEGIGSENDDYLVYYAERTLWHLNLKISGNAGHGSLLLENTAGEKLNYIVGKLMAFRAHEVKRLANDASLTLGDVTTVNLTKINGGVQSNVVPPLLEVTFDIRIAPTVDIEALEQQIRQWCADAGGGIELDFIVKNPRYGSTKIDATNSYWLAYKDVMDQFGFKVHTRVIPGATDVRYLRNEGIPALGFSPIVNTPILLHDHDEFLGAETFLRGIEIYKKLIPAVSNA